jgi:hypothetical protein
MTVYQKIFMPSYRLIAVAILSTILAFAGGTLFLLFFYMGSSSWGAPVILSKSSARVMDASASVLRAQQTEDALVLSLRGNAQEQQSLVKRIAWLKESGGRFDTAISSQTQVKRDNAQTLTALAKKKQEAVARMGALQAANQRSLASIERDLRAGVITREAAARSRAQLAAGDDSVASGQLAIAALDAQIESLKSGVDTIEGGAHSVEALEVLGRVQRLRYEQDEAEERLRYLKAEATTKEAELANVRDLQGHLMQSPLALAATSKGASHAFAFVPYENEASAKDGVAVYACHLGLVWCSKVGTVHVIAHEEEKVRHPIFPSDVRGYLVDLRLDKDWAAKEKVVFFGSRPLWIL